MKNRVAVLIATSVLLLFSASNVHAGTKKFCFQSLATYTDNGFSVNGSTEDYWTSDTYRLARGMRATVRFGSSTGGIIFDDYLGDGLGTGDPGLGCIDPFEWIDSTTVFWVRLRPALGKVNGNDLTVWHVDGPETLSTTFSNALSGTFTISVDPGATTTTRGEAWRTYQAAAYSLWRHAGGMTGKTYRVHISSSFVTNFDRNNNPPRVELSENSDDDKFIISHELGHFLYYYANSGLQPTCSFSASECPSVDSTAHSMGSREKNSCAAMEGWSHFYAADIWNDHAQANCVFKYYKGDQPTIDCEGGSTGYPVQFLENQCSIVSGHAVELDWLRTLWDVHTGSSPPSFTQMRQWMSSVSSSSFETQAYTRFDTAANQNSAVNSNWDSAKLTNGIDH